MKFVHKEVMVKALPKKYDDVSAIADRLSSWLQEQQKKRVEDVVAGVHAKGHRWNLALWVMAGIGAVLTFFNTMASMPSYPGRPDFSWYTFGTYTAIGGGIALMLAVVLSKIRSYPTTIMRQAKRSQIQPQFNADPLVQRARLIAEAASAYAIYCARYRQWREEVEEEIVPPNEEKADEYHAFLTAAREVILAASTNFWNVIERIVRAEEFAKLHPQAAAAQDGDGLALLLDELKVGITPPSMLNAQADPVQALEDETRLARVAQELRVLDRAG